MINVKPSTNTWSESKQNSQVRSNGLNTNDSQAFKKRYGDKSLGEVLNKVADPNYVDTSKRVKGHGNNELGKDAFFKLMLTQLKYQDPTNPLESHEMAAQLAQFSSVEKMANMDETLKAIHQGQKPAHDFQALNLIGKAVRSDSTNIIRNDENDAHDINFKIAGDANRVEIQIEDMQGKKQRLIEMRELKKGTHSIKWDGLTEQGFKARMGQYKARISAYNSAGQKLHIDSKVEGVITGVNFTSNGAMLLIGDSTVRMSDVKKIWDPNIQANPNAQKGSDKKPPVAKNNAPVAPVQSNLGEVAMDPKLTNTVMSLGDKK